MHLIKRTVAVVCNVALVVSFIEYHRVGCLVGLHGFQYFQYPFVESCSSLVRPPILLPHTLKRPFEVYEFVEKVMSVVRTLLN